MGSGGCSLATWLRRPAAGEPTGLARGEVAAIGVATEGGDAVDVIAVAKGELVGARGGGRAGFLSRLFKRRRWPSPSLILKIKSDCSFLVLSKN